MNRQPFFCALATVALIFLAPAMAPSQATGVGSLSESRAAQISREVGGSYRSAKVGDEVYDGTAIRTQRRAMAEVSFHDKSVLRINERADVVIHDSSVLRRMELRSGTAWLHVTHGVSTSVQTPVGTAAVRGTEFVIGSSGYLHVIEGAVELNAKGVQLMVYAGQTVIFGAGAPVVVSGSTIVGPGGEGVPPDWYQVTGTAGQAIVEGGPGKPDGLFGLLGLLLIRQGHGTPPPVPTSKPVPELGTFTVLSIGVATAIRRGRRKRMAAERNREEIT